VEEVFFGEESRMHTKGGDGLVKEWKTPDFEEIELRAEVTAYVGHWE